MIEYLVTKNCIIKMSELRYIDIQRRGGDTDYFVIAHLIDGTEIYIDKKESREEGKKTIEEIGMQIK